MLNREHSVQERLRELRAEMVATQLAARGVRDERVLNAFLEVPRHEFVSIDLLDRAYEDFPLPIEAGQTISQPYIVAAMVQAAEISSADVVLEIGTGSGYQAAILSKLAATVYSIERHAMLAEQARRTLERLGYSNVTVVVGDGTEGYVVAAPYQAILAAAAAPRIPTALVEQLADRGRLVVPIGSRTSQTLQLIRKRGSEVSVVELDKCVFVPLVGKWGFEEKKRDGNP